MMVPSGTGAAPFALMRDRSTNAIEVLPTIRVDASSITRRPATFWRELAGEGADWRSELAVMPVLTSQGHDVLCTTKYLALCRLRVTREERMHQWGRRIRGAIGMGLTWAAAWFGAGVLLARVPFSFSTSLWRFSSRRSAF